MDRRLADDLLFLAALLASAAIFYLVGLHFDGLLVLAFVALAVFVVLAFFRVDLGVLAVVVLLPYFMAPISVDHHPWPPSEWLMIAVGVAAVGVLAATALGRTNDENLNTLTNWGWPRRPDWSRLTSSRFVLPGFIFLLAAFTSAAMADEKTLAARDLLEVVVEPMCFFGVLLIFTPLKDAARRERSLLLIGIAVVVAGLVPSLIGIGQLITGQHLVPIGEPFERIIGPYQGPDNFGLLLDRTIPMALALLLVPAFFLGRGTDLHRPGGKRLGGYRGTFTLAFAIMLAALVFTFVLGAWLGTSIALVMLLLVRFRHGWWLVAAATLVLTAGVALGAGKQHAVTAGKRLQIWGSAIHMIEDNPILGIGMDNFQHWYAPKSGDGVSPKAHSESGRCYHGLGYIQNSPSALKEPCFSHPHNLILDTWLSTGIVGLIAFIWLQVIFWSILWRTRTLLTLSPVLLGAGGAMLAGLLHGMVDNGYFLVDLSGLMWLFFAIASMFDSFARSAPTPPVPAESRTYLPTS